MPRRALAHALVTLAAALALAGCADETPPPDHALAPDSLTLAHDSSLEAPVAAAISQWPDDRPLIRRSPDASVSIALDAAATHSPPDVLIIAAQTAPPAAPNAPISTRPWLADPIVFATRAEETRTVDEVLIDPETRFAIAHESEPLGQYTRFGLRKLSRWELIKDRALRYSSHDELLDAVEASSADATAVYASQLAPRLAGDAPALARRDELVVSDSARRAFVVIAMTPQGVELARWLADPQNMALASPAGYRPDARRPRDAP